ncbi:MAG: DNA (cytosine-5-)-methyltransferase [Proteobacteria bacterium]|nr:DNA (cytosine-5-)-methyltransferase [Pseudomonadota bacterium]
MQAKEALRVAYARFSREEVARELDTDEKTLVRWMDGSIPRPRFVWHAVSNLLRQVPARVETSTAPEFTFVDLFAGIGGTRLAFQRAGGQCVFTSEYDKYCVKTYQANFHPDHDVVGDIRKITVADDVIREHIPDHDVLVAGFPCQPFSIAGVSKKNSLGRLHGFECKTQGTLFFDICEILKVKRPSAFMLENVRNLKSHDRGNTFRIIMDSLHELGYEVDYKVIDARPWVPQHRERVFIVGFRQPTAFTMDMVSVPKSTVTLASILHPEDGSETVEEPFTCFPNAAVSSKYTLTSHLWSYLRNYKKKHEAAGNGFGYGLVTTADVARTLSARYYKDGSEILISRGGRKVPRRLTPRECARLMGFPDNFKIPVSDTQAYKQFGNSVVVDVVEAVARAMRPHVLALIEASKHSAQVAMRV